MMTDFYILGDISLLPFKQADDFPILKNPLNSLMFLHVLQTHQMHTIYIPQNAEEMLISNTCMSLELYKLFCTHNKGKSPGERTVDAV